MARILIIDDDIQILNMLRQTLGREGYDVVAALDGKEGLRLYRENPADLIITDLIMPEKEGLEIIMELRRAFPDVKIIAISGGGRLDPAQYLRMAKSFGAQYAFAKPVEREELLKAIEKLLKQSL
jgi:DNA-binding response OmpR family regulator